MTMDVQNSYQNYKETSPESKSSIINIESAKTILPKTEVHSVVQNSGKGSKRSFDVAFLMMPDEKLRQKQPEKQLRISKQLFSNEEWDQPTKRSPDIYKHNEYSNENAEQKDLEEDRIRMNNNISPAYGSDINIDVGTDEYPNKLIYYSDSENSDRSRSRPNSNESAARHPKFLPEYKNKIFDDPTLIRMQTRSRYQEKLHDMSPKSAFTKVSNFSLRSPNPSVSPDNLLYQNSVSPPLSAASPPNFLGKSASLNALFTPNHIMNTNNFFKTQNVPSSSPNYPEPMAMHSRPAAAFSKNTEFQEKQSDLKSSTHVSPSKLSFLPFRPDIPYLQAGSSYPFNVQNFPSPNQEFMKFHGPPREPVNPLITNPAAAILSTLLPPTLAAFSLPAQNVCAKCNISFRMTSDLVYHMRTHHKSESSGDPLRRKREEKLKCPVCNESFRERHHLTRHMTAHQDKEGDMEVIPNGQAINKKNKQYYSHNGGSNVNK